MNVTIWLKETSQKLEYRGITNAYTKGDLYCLYDAGKNYVEKFPVENIWRVRETYSKEPDDNPCPMKNEPNFCEENCRLYKEGCYDLF